MTPEGKVKAEIRKQLKKLKVYHFWPVPTGMGKRTIDILVCYKGLFIGIEAKAPRKEPTTLQWRTLTEIQEAGGLPLVIDSVAMAKQLPELLKNVGLDLAP